MKHKIFILTFLFFIFLSTNLFAQYAQWVSRYNGTGNGRDEIFRSIALDGSGNVYVTGGSEGIGTGFDYATIKYNNNGVQQWVQRHTGSGNSFDYPFAMTLDDSANVYVTGECNLDIVTIKYSSAGVLRWIRSYNGPENRADRAWSIAVDDSGNVYVAGQSGVDQYGRKSDFVTIKYNSSGVQQWVTGYGGSGNRDDGVNSMAVDAYGNVFVTGWSSVTINPRTCVTIKYNSSGVQQWLRTYTGNGESLALDNSGNVYIAGWSGGYSYDFVTVKYNTSGVQQWFNIYNGSGSGEDQAYTVFVDDFGYVYSTGWSLESGTSWDCILIKYSTSGVQQWIRTYNGPGNYKDNGYAIAADDSGNVFVVGDSYGNGTERDYVTIKYNSAGVQQWVQRYNGPGNSYDIARSIVADGFGNVYVTGYSCGIGTSTDYGIIKYSQPVGIQTLSNEIPKEYKLIQNYPNPFNPSTKIKFDIPMSSYVKLIVYDVLGREIKTLVNEKLNAGRYDINWDGSSHPSGVYFYKMVTIPDGRQADDYVSVKKMLLVK